MPVVTIETTASAVPLAQPTGPGFVLDLLGGWNLTVRGSPAPLAVSARRVVAYVAVRGPSTRHQLVGALWPDTGERQAANCLRSALWRINHSCPALLETTEELVSLDRRVRLDLAELRELLHLVLTAEPGSVLPLLPEASYLGCAELLPDWYDDWLLVEQEQLRQQRLHAMERIAAELMGRGEWARSLEMALAAVQVDPLRESSHRAVIEVHLGEGNASEALRHYQAYRELLAEELGLEPSIRLSRLLPVRQN